MFRNTQATAGQRRVESRESRAERREARGEPFSLTCDLRPLASRLGISLTEVLIAMGILTIGLLGVAAIFPVGSYYLQKGEIADRGSAIAQATFSEAIARGWLNPENWLVWEDTGLSGVTSPSPAITRTFQRQFAEMLRRKKADQLARQYTLALRESEINAVFGSVFVIDPLGAASSVPFTGGNQSFKSVGVYPATRYRVTNNENYVTQWRPWMPAFPAIESWPVRRVTLRPLGFSPHATEIAAAMQYSADDLSMDLPDAQDRPALLPLVLATSDLNVNGLRDDPLVRRLRGNYSWVITVVPTTSAARDALASDPSAYEYEVSVVVFYRRPLGAAPPVDPSTSAEVAGNNMELLRLNERPVGTKILSTGLSGGEVLLETIDGAPPMTSSLAGPSESPFVNLKTGQWIMLCGPHPNSSDERPMIVARWYRVLSIEGKDTRLDASGNPTSATGQPERRLVSLRGSQWPWQPAPSPTTTSHLSNNLYACIVTGAVAVHAKTIRLEGNSVWSGGAGGIGPSPPPGTPYKTGGG